MATNRPTRPHVPHGNNSVHFELFRTPLGNSKKAERTTTPNWSGSRYRCQPLVKHCRNIRLAQHVFTSRNYRDAQSQKTRQMSYVGRVALPIELANMNFTLHWDRIGPRFSKHRQSISPRRNKPQPRILVVRKLTHDWGEQQHLASQCPIHQPASF